MNDARSDVARSTESSTRVLAANDLAPTRELLAVSATAFGDPEP